MRLLRTVVAALAVAALGWPGSASGQTTGHDPILFIHGWNENSSMWTNFIGRFTSDGWSPSLLNTMDYNSAQSNRTIAEQVNQRVDQISAANGGVKVDVITHSMGGLSSRWYIKFLGGTEEVEDWVSLGGPNHGTFWASTPACFTPTSCREMRRGSSFLNELNAGDETPGTVRYGTWWSPCDEVIIPQESTILDGAQNTRTRCLEHIQLSQDGTVYKGVREFVR
jgi:triacylglycerol lipase